MQVPEVFLCEDGDAVVLDEGAIRVERKAVSASLVYVDGLDTAGTVQGVIRDRRHLADDGVVVVTLAVDGATGEIVQGPDLDSHGFMDDPAPVFELAAERIKTEVGRLDLPIDYEQARRKVKGAVNSVTRAETGRRAVVIPVVLEV
jgi:ribonuclease J